MTTLAGPERLDRFMARAAGAYYAGRDPFGREGDFTTAPEISQCFGECLGLWSAVTWMSMGRPSEVILAELGPGRGTLMADALRAIRQMVPDFAAALRLHLVERSPLLRQAQASLLGEAVVAWHDDIADLPPGPALILGNEFLDALPIRQFIRRGDGWMERHVLEGAFVEEPAQLGLPLPAEAPEGAIAEYGEAGREVVTALSRRLAAQGGAALFIDYGPGESGLGDSLQAVRRHEPVNPLSEPGSADITAHVDFAALARAARAAGAAAHGPMPQGPFLQSLGLSARATALAAADPRRAGQHIAAAQRLILPEGMGRLFKALALCHPDLPAPPGLEAA